MREKKKIFFNKKILIYGLGKTGISSYIFLKKNNKVFLFDDNKKTSINKKIINKSYFDYILVSPGINIRRCILKNYIKNNLYWKILLFLDIHYLRVEIATFRIYTLMFNIMDTKSNI